MKKQTFRDRMHEHEGMEHHMRHSKHHSSHHSSPHAMYRNEVEMPHLAAQGHESAGMGAEPDPLAEDYRGQAADLAYGQAGKHGFMSDDKKIRAQFRPSYDDHGL